MNYAWLTMKDNVFLPTNGIIKTDIKKDYCKNAITILVINIIWEQFLNNKTVVPDRLLPAQQLIFLCSNSKHLLLTSYKISQSFASFWFVSPSSFFLFFISSIVIIRLHLWDREEWRGSGLLFVTFLKGFKRLRTVLCLFPVSFVSVL